MAFTETFRCDICGKPKSEESEHWWLVWTEISSLVPNEPEQAVVHLTRWGNFLAHSSDVRHLCGASCVQTWMNRWILQKR